MERLTYLSNLSELENPTASGTPSLNFDVFRGSCFGLRIFWISPHFW